MPLIDPMAACLSETQPTKGWALSCGIPDHLLDKPLHSVTNVCLN